MSASLMSGAAPPTVPPSPLKPRGEILFVCAPASPYEPSNVADARELADGVFAGMFSVDARAVLVLGDGIAMNVR